MTRIWLARMPYIGLGVCPSNDLDPHQRVLSCSKTYFLDTESTLRRLSE